MTTLPGPADLPYLCPECGHPYVSQLAADYCCRDRWDNDAA